MIAFRGVLEMLRDLRQRSTWAIEAGSVQGCLLARPRNERKSNRLVCVEFSPGLRSAKASK